MTTKPNRPQFIRSTKTATPKHSKPNLPYHDHVAYTLSDARRVRLFGEISMPAMAHIVNSLEFLVLKSTKKPIEIMLNSPGGSVVDGLAMYDFIMSIRKKTPINMTVAGACMSMGAIILQAATVRRAYEHSAFLLHEIRYDPGRETVSNHKDLEKHAAKMQTKLDQIIVNRSNMTIAELKKLTERRDYTISAQEALQHGLIDRIV